MAAQFGNAIDKLYFGICKLDLERRPWMVSCYANARPRSGMCHAIPYVSKANHTYVCHDFSLRKKPTSCVSTLIKAYAQGIAQSGQWPGIHRRWPVVKRVRCASRADGKPGDRKSTRLNSSHVAISYAVFCL